MGAQPLVQFRGEYVCSLHGEKGLDHLFFRYCSFVAVLEKYSDMWPRPCPVGLVYNLSIGWSQADYCSFINLSPRHPLISGVCSVFLIGWSGAECGSFKIKKSQVVYSSVWWVYWFYAKTAAV